MRTKVNIALVALANCVLLGCASFQTTAGKSLVTVTQTVDAAMQGWSIWVNMGKATPDQQAKVRAAYEKYQAVELAAEHAYVALSANPDRAIWQQAYAALLATQGDLVAIITAFKGVK